MGVSQAPHQVVRGTVLAAVVCLAVGCASVGTLVPDVVGPPTGPVSEVATYWEPQVTFTPDPTRNGTPIPGLVGRLFLFGEDKGRPLAGEGAIIVDLYDPDHPRADDQGTVIPLERWQIDKDTLTRLLRRDPIGWGYTLFLPWSTYRPDLTKLLIRAQYAPVKGMPIYTGGSLVTLNNGLGNLTITTNQKVLTTPPAGATTAVAPLPPLPPLPQAGN
jgi:hypothetical protein